MNNKTIIKNIIKTFGCGTAIIGGCIAEGREYQNRMRSRNYEDIRFQEPSQSVLTKETNCLFGNCFDPRPECNAFDPECNYRKPTNQSDQTFDKKRTSRKRMRQATFNECKACFHEQMEQLTKGCNGKELKDLIEDIEELHFKIDCKGIETVANHFTHVTENLGVCYRWSYKEGQPCAIEKKYAISKKDFNKKGEFKKHKKGKKLGKLLKKMRKCIEEDNSSIKCIASALSLSLGINLKREVCPKENKRVYHKKFLNRYFPSEDKVRLERK